MNQNFQATLTVTSCQPKNSGVSKTTGNPWTIYEVFALNENGQPMTEKLKSFDPIPLGQAITFEVEPGEYKGTLEYTLKLPKSMRQGGGSNKIDELRVRVERIEAHLGLGQAPVGPDIPLPTGGAGFVPPAAPTGPSPAAPAPGFGQAATPGAGFGQSAGAPAQQTGFGGTPAPPVAPTDDDTIPF